MTSRLIGQFAAEWRAATRHAFLDRVADGSLQLAPFEAWLVQDYLFVDDLLVFQARLLARAPRAAQAVLAGGLVGLTAELGWFEAHAARRGLALDAQRSPTTARYQVLLDQLQAEPFAVALVGLWTIERAYLDAWRGALPCAPLYREFVDHWTAPDFADYVASLEHAANAALRGAADSVVARAQAVFREVVTLEHAFWAMAWSERAT